MLYILINFIHVLSKNKHSSRILILLDEVEEKLAKIRKIPSIFSSLLCFYFNLRTQDLIVE